MRPLRIKDGVTFSKPDEWDASQQGECSDLAVRRRFEGNLLVFESAWEPTPRELEILNRGGSIVLSICGLQPPVRLGVEEPPQ